MTELKLVIFDVDGTLVDSQAHITASMTAAFFDMRLSPPSRKGALSIVGLSLPVAMARLVPEGSQDTIKALVESYKWHFARLRHANDKAAQSPLYPGAMEAIKALAEQDEILLGIATGKSRRGLDHLSDLHGFGPMFQTMQVADDHPSKPHPSMIEACLAETGVEAAHAVIVGDTSFDMEMGRSAGIAALGVSWGYHPSADLHASGAREVLDSFEELPAALSAIWGQS